MDIVRRKAVYFEGENGEKIVHKDVPEKYKEQMARWDRVRREAMLRSACWDPLKLCRAARSAAQRLGVLLTSCLFTARFLSPQEAKRHELVEKVAEVDEELAELYLGVRPRDGLSRLSRSITHTDEYSRNPPF